MKRVVLLVAAGATALAGISVAPAGPADAAGAAAVAPGPSPAAHELHDPDTVLTLSDDLARLVGAPRVSARSLAGVPRPAAAPTAAADEAAVGDVRLWPASDLSRQFPIDLYLKSFTLTAVGEHSEVWIASGADAVSAGTAFPAGDCRNDVAGSTTVTPDQAAAIAAQFDRRIHPAGTRLFNAMAARDGSGALSAIPGAGIGATGGGERLVILVDNIRDEDFYRPTRAKGLLGYFSSLVGDLVDRNVITLDAFDWAHRTGVNPPDEQSADLCASRAGRPRLMEGTLAHEWNHLLLFGLASEEGELAWLSEGIADWFISRLGYADPTLAPSSRTMEIYFRCFQGYGEVTSRGNPFPEACGGPQNSLTVFEDFGLIGRQADYGQTWSFLIFLHDRYGDEFISALHRDIRRVGLQSLEAQLKRFAPGDKVGAVLHDFQLMNLLDATLDRPGASVQGIARSRVVSPSLRASINIDAPSAFDAPGAAANGADYVLLRDADDRALRGGDLRSLRFRGERTVPVGSDDIVIPLNDDLTLAEDGGAERVDNWHVALVGIDRAGRRALVRAFDGPSFDLSARQLKAFAGYPTVVAVITQDARWRASFEDDKAAARYALTANGHTQPGG